MSAKNHQGFQRYFANASWMFAEQILRLTAGLFVGVWVARYLGPEQFGIFSYAIAIASIFTCIAKLGLDSIVVRNLLQEPERTKHYLGTAFWLKLGGALFMLGIVALAIQWTATDYLTNLYLLIIASGSIFQCFEVVDFYFQSRVLSKFVSICKLTQLIFSSLLKLYFIVTGAELIFFIAVYLFDQCTLALSLYVSYRCQKTGSFYRFFDKNIAKRMLNDSWPLLFSGLAVMIYIRIDQLMIKQMLGEKELGFYSAAARLSEVWIFIPTIIISSVFPSIVNAKKVSLVFYKQRLQQLFTLMTWLAIGIVLPVTFFADSLISLLYGPNYHEAGVVLSIHIWGVIFVFMGVATGAYLTAESFTRKSLFRTVFGAIINVLLNLYFIPHYGIKGAAIATVISQFAANFGYDCFDKDLRNLLRIKIKGLIPIYLIWIFKF